LPSPVAILAKSGGAPSSPSAAPWPSLAECRAVTALEAAGLQASSLPSAAPWPSLAERRAVSVLEAAGLQASRSTSASFVEAEKHQSFPSKRS